MPTAMSPEFQPKPLCFQPRDRQKGKESLTHTGCVSPAMPWHRLLSRQQGFVRRHLDEHLCPAGIRTVLSTECGSGFSGSCASLDPPLGVCPRPPQPRPAASATGPCALQPFCSVFLSVVTAQVGSLTVKSHQYCVGHGCKFLVVSQG